VTTNSKNFKVKNGLDATGTITGLDLVSTASSGNEGGEIRLATAATGSTLTAGTVTIDVFQNKLRIFETGGTNRGAYIDLSAATTGVGSNLLSGGGAGTVTSITAGTTGLTGGTITSSGTIDIDTTKVPRLLTNTNTFAASTGATTLIVKQGATQSTTSLQEWQDSAGTILSKISSSGALNATSISNTANTGPVITLSSNQLRIDTRAVGSVGLIVKGTASQTASLQEWQDSTGTLMSYIDSSGSFKVGPTGTYASIGSTGTIGMSYGTINGNLGGTMLSITSNNVANAGIKIKSIASQTANMVEILNSTGTTVVSKIDTTGNITGASFVKTSGTSTQFLKADGSVDSSTYLTSAVTSIAGTTNQIAVSGATGSVTLSLPTAVTVDTINVTTLNVSGTQNIFDVTNLSVTDSLIYLADSQFDADVLDIGIYGAYGDAGAGHFHTGLVRDATDGIWKLVSGTPEPASNVVNFTGATYDTLLAGSFKKNGGTSSEFLKADGSVDSSTYLTTGNASSTYAPLVSPSFTTPSLGEATATSINSTTIPSSATLITTTSGTALLAADIAGGTAGQIPYQSAADTTVFIATGTAGQVLTSNGTSAPTWSTPSASVASTDFSPIFMMMGA
jgi:hypothetical protein